MPKANQGKGRDQATHYEDQRVLTPSTQHGGRSRLLKMDPPSEEPEALHQERRVKYEDSASADTIQGRCHKRPFRQGCKIQGTSYNDLEDEEEDGESQMSGSSQFRKHEVQALEGGGGE